MKLTVIGSSSSGNGYLLQASNGETLMLEAGIKMQEVKRVLNWTLAGVVGCLCTHRHGDHSKYLGEVAACGIRILTIEDVLTSRGLSGNHFAKVIEPLHGYILGEFKVYVLPVCHDVPCVGFIITHEEMGRLLFLTDTMMFEYRIPNGIAHIMIEANYADDILQANIENGTVPASTRNRLLNSHMELETTAEILRGNDLSDVLNVILLHLSGRNSDAGRFKAYIEKASLKTTYVARPGFSLELSTQPF
jgi:phosphoribosyl 1,2-cyclic phosphodiesterase